MKRISTIIVGSVACMLLPLYVSAQKVRLIDGNLDPLKGIQKMNIQFDYSNMGVGKFEKESEYITKKKTELDEKEPGRGATWEKAWIADRQARFEPQFKELFMKHSDITVASMPDEKYTLIFKTTFTEPGFNAVVVKKSAQIDGEAWIVETANPSKVIAKFSVADAPGRTVFGNDYDTGERLQESYATAGKQLGKTIKKELH